MLNYITVAAVSVVTGLWIGVGLGISGTKGARETNKRLLRQAKDFKEKAEFWSKECQEQIKHKEHIQAQLTNYKHAYKELMQERINNGSSANYDKDVQEALKFAMTNSHPDKPTGDQETFIKFHKLYKKYCK